MHCRIFGLADLENIFSIEKASQAYPWSLQQIKDCLVRPDAVCLGTEQAGLWCGYIVGGSVLDEAEIWNFAVLPSHRRQGIGSTLLTHILNIFKAKAVDKIFLEVRASNQNAILCYKKAGFKPIGIRKGYYETDTGREDAVLMRFTRSIH